MLCRLRDPEVPRLIWIDSICINQEDNDEKSVQVQLMTTVYACALRVNVWLEEPGGDEKSRQQSKRALDTILDAVSNNNRTRAVRAHPGGWEAVKALYQRSWFRRIWVLQEVAAARNITIVCQYHEMDGHAFCSGVKVLAALETLNNNNEKPFLPVWFQTGPSVLSAAVTDSSESRIRSSLRLMKGASLRPRAVATTSSQPEAFSLNIMPLYDLINLYRDRSATDPRDKVYALLGMSSETPAGIFPDYNSTWEHTFYRIVRCFVGGGASITTWSKEEIAIIRTKFLVIGEIIHVGATEILPSKLNVQLKLSAWEPELKTHPMLDLPSELVEWSIQAPTTPLLKGDIVCFLEDTNRVTIIRQHESYDYCLVISINTLPTKANTEFPVDTRQWRDVANPRWRPPLVELPLIWDWSTLAQVPQEQASCYSHLLSEISQQPKNFNEMAHGWEHTARLLVQGRKFLTGVKLLRRLLEETETLYGRNTQEVVAALIASNDILQAAGQKDWSQLLELEAKMIQPRARIRAPCSSNFYELLRHLEGRHVDHFVPFLECWRSTLKIATSLWHGMAVGQPGKALEWIIARVTRNDIYQGNSRESIEEALRNPGYLSCYGVSFAVAALNYSQDQTQTIDSYLVMETVQSIEVNPAREEQSLFAITSLLTLWRDRVPKEVKQEALEAMIKSHPSAHILLTIFLDSWGDSEFDAERLVIVASTNREYGLPLVENLLDRYGPRLLITEEVLKTVLDVDPVAVAIEMLLLFVRRRKRKIVVTETMVYIAWNKSPELGKLLSLGCVRDPDCEAEVIRVAPEEDDISDAARADTTRQLEQENDYAAYLNEYMDWWDWWEWEIDESELRLGSNYSSPAISPSASDFEGREGTEEAEEYLTSLSL
ncbi:heterokaryon incompatibility protein-domain-containing protein [Podospora fimiseda]|uniref:Heterokaryon incompatibility protein-domain-containing protein n=1 Tax=Podospora fimiseda TaxID=252190 RepID=A0AAN7BRD5_9PEZI|nr:heterokaryon incompatibility protein-domain-containing protein [Podospora fimiseda]